MIDQLEAELLTVTDWKRKREIQDMIMELEDTNG